MHKSTIFGISDIGRHLISIMVPHSHSSIEHAEEGINALSYEFNNTLNTQTIYVRLENKNSGCFSATTCENSKTITVYEQSESIITKIKSIEWTIKNIIKALVLTLGEYEYSIDGINYQDNPEFTNLNPGIYTVYIRDKNGCAITSKEIVLLMYPKFLLLTEMA